LKHEDREAPVPAFIFQTLEDRWDLTDRTNWRVRNRDLLFRCESDDQDGDNANDYDNPCGVHFLVERPA